jgi:hypothetical protein
MSPRETDILGSQDGTSHLVSESEKQKEVAVLAVDTY